MRGETGLRWNEAEEKIEMDDEWWESKLQCLKGTHTSRTGTFGYSGMGMMVFLPMFWPLGQWLGLLVKVRYHHVRLCPIDQICMLPMRKSILGTITPQPLPLLHFYRCCQHLYATISTTSSY